MKTYCALNSQQWVPVTKDTFRRLMLQPNRQRLRLSLRRTTGRTCFRISLRLKRSLLRLVLARKQGQEVRRTQEKMPNHRHLRPLSLVRDLHASLSWVVQSRQQAHPRNQVRQRKVKLAVLHTLWTCSRARSFKTRRSVEAL